MDDICYPLVSPTEEEGTVVVPTVVVEPEPDEGQQVDLLGQLRRCVHQFALLFWVALLTIEQLRRQLVELRCEANYRQALHQRAVQRETALKAQVQQLQGEIRELKRRLFGRKTETSSSNQSKSKGNTDDTANNNGDGSNTSADSSDANTSDNGSKRPRGQQPGSKGHGRRNHDHLETTHETCDLPAEQKCCGTCGEPLEEIPGTADGNILEVEVCAHRRRYHRKRYRRTCTCCNQPLLLTAPPPDKLIPKSNLGISVWTFILQHKFQFFQPLHRVLAELRSADLDLAAGTITDGLKRLVPLFEPLYSLLSDYNRQQEHWWADETRWRVFEKHPDKANFVWMLWVFATRDSVVFVLDPTRAHDVPEDYVGEDAEGIMNVDRYKAYKAMAQVKAGDIILAFCWAHVRRDFLGVFTGWSELTDWAWSWIEEIGLLYHRNDQRLAVLEDAEQFAQADQRLRAQVEHVRQRCEEELAQPNLREAQRKVLTSLQEHWSGLTVFVDHPEVPLDNNYAERCQRGPVVARKNFYGSGALWSGRLAAMLFSLFQTVQLWGMDAGKWLTAYLTACAQAGGKPPPDPERYLPWNMTEPERQLLSPANAKPPAPTAATPEANTTV